MELGARIGILINPNELTVSVYRPNGDIEVLTGNDKLTIAELFTGWEVAISELWPPVFE